MIIKDFHTHNLMAENAIINVPKAWMLFPEKFEPREGALYSVGIHPWWTNNQTEAQHMLQVMPLLLKHPQVVAIGECGLDKIKGACMAYQVAIFEQQVLMAEQMCLPVTLHIVRAFDILLHLHKQLHPTTQWTIHGFRGKAALAMQLLNAGIDLSFGTKYNAESWALTPPNRRHIETDSE